MGNSEPNLQMPTLSSKSRGLSLFNGLMALFFIAVGTWIFLPKVICFTPREKVDRVTAKTQISAFLTATKVFKEENGFFPGTLNDLVAQPNGAKHWHQYLESIPLDPWGHPYLYKYPGAHGSNSFDMASMGPDGQSGTKDDITLNR